MHSEKELKEINDELKRLWKEIFRSENEGFRKRQNIIFLELHAKQAIMLGENHESKQFI